MAKKPVSRMLGEASREVAVLLLVFIPLGAVESGITLTRRGVAGVLAFTVGLSIAFFWLGVWLERLDDDDV